MRKDQRAIADRVADSGVREPVHIVYFG